MSNLKKNGRICHETKFKNDSFKKKNFMTDSTVFKKTVESVMKIKFQKNGRNCREN